MIPSAGILNGVSDDLFDDEYDPLAPPPGGESDLPLEEELGTGGFAGGGVVKLWFEQGRLKTVRVSPTWFDKLEPGQTLAQAFEEAFLLSSAAIVEEEDAALDTSELMLNLPPLSAAAVDAYAAMLHDHSAAWQRAIDEADHLPPNPSEATGEHTGAVVMLNRAGHPARVMFDEEWLDEAQVGSICSAVYGATMKAYQAFVPTTDHKQRELDRFRLEHEVLMAGFRRLLIPRREEQA